MPKDEVIATLDDESYQAALAGAQAAYGIAVSDVAKNGESGNAPALFEAKSRVQESRARLAMEQQRLDFTRLRAPAAGIIVTPRLEERVGQNLLRGAEFCVVADVGKVTVEAATRGTKPVLRVDGPGVLTEGSARAWRRASGRACAGSA